MHKRVEKQVDASLSQTSNNNNNNNKNTTMAKLPNLSDPIFSTFKYPTHGVIVRIIWNDVHRADDIVSGT